MEINGEAYFFRSNSFSGRITRWDGSQGFIRNSKKGMPDVVACIQKQVLNSMGVYNGLPHPDVDFVGIFVGFELKAPKGRQSPEQKLAQERIEAAGGKYFIVRTPEEFEDALKSLM